MSDTEELTMQRYFTETVEYLRGQETWSKYGENCRYLHPTTGNKCAVGYWLPEGHPAEDLIMPVGNVIYKYPHLRGVVCPDSGAGANLAIYLQGLHDAEENRNENQGGLSDAGEQLGKQIAEIFGLTYTPPS